MKVQLFFLLLINGQITIKMWEDLLFLHQSNHPFMNHGEWRRNFKAHFIEHVLQCLHLIKNKKEKNNNSVMNKYLLKSNIVIKNLILQKINSLKMTQQKKLKKNKIVMKTLRQYKEVLCKEIMQIIVITLKVQMLLLLKFIV